jgi:hypothetical protein
MGEYPKRSEIQTFHVTDADERICNGTVVEIKTDTRYGYTKNEPNHLSDNWFANDPSFRIDENDNNIAIAEVIAILTNAETHPYGIKVEILTGDQGRAQRILTGKELEKYRQTREFHGYKHRRLDVLSTSLIEQTIQMKRKMQLTEEEREYEQKTKLFPKSEIPSHEDDKNEFKASFKTPTKENVGENIPENMGTNLKRSVTNAVAAFANSEGGRLFIGIDDKTGKVIGSKSGSEMMNLKTNEKYDHYKRAIQDTIFEFTKRRPDNIEFQKGEDEEFLVLHIERGTEPTYVNEKNKELYYIRLDGESVPCYGGDMVRHMKKRFPNDIGSNKNDTGRWNQNRRDYRR